MGFQSNQSGNNKPLKFLKIKSIKDNKDVIINKCFELSEKNCEPRNMLSPSNYPIPFYGYLTNIEVKTDNKVMVQGQERNIPIIKLFLQDDDNERYILTLNWASDKGKINTIVSTILNSLSSVQKFGLLKLSIFESKNGDVSNFNISVKNDANWNPSKPNFDVFKKQADGSDPTKCTWKFDVKDLVPHEVKKNVEGEEVLINNVKKHWEFYTNLAKEITEKIKGTTYPQAEVSVSDTSSKPTTSTDFSGKPMKEATKTVADDDDDLPF